MKKTISFFTKGKALWCSLLLVGGLMLLGTSHASAQESANGTVNPYTHIGEKLSVPSYPLGTFERAHTMSILENILAGLKQTISNGGGSNLQKLKYSYCNAMLADIHTRHIAVEITLLTSLAGLNEQKSTIGIQHSQLQALYSEVVAQLQ